MSNEAANPPDGKWPGLSIAQWIIRSVVAVASIYLANGIWTTHSKKSEVDGLIATVREDQSEAAALLEEAEQQKEHMESRAQQAADMRKQLDTIYRQYRTIEDIAENRSTLIVHAGTSGRLNNSIRLSVPSGTHRLIAKFIKSDPDNKSAIEEKTLTHELNGPAGYFIELDHSLAPGGKYRDPRQLRLKLTSNSSSFADVNEPIFEPFPTPTTSRYGTGSMQTTVSFPNQYRTQTSQPTEPLDTSLLLMKSRCSNHRDADPPFDLNIEIRLKSEGPITADAVTVESFKYRRPKPFDEKYVGQGKYELTELDVATKPSE
ncbi:MAG: hypothetical protein AAF497_03535 [Planctomycetota bacterium]